MRKYFGVGMLHVHNIIEEIFSMLKNKNLPVPFLQTMTFSLENLKFTDTALEKDNDEEINIKR